MQQVGYKVTIRGKNHIVNFALTKMKKGNKCLKNLIPKTQSLMIVSTPHVNSEVAKNKGQLSL